MTCKLTQVDVIGAKTYQATGSNIAAQAGSTDAVANPVNIAAGQSQQFDITAIFAKYNTGNVKIYFNCGSVGNPTQTFSAKAQ